ncbi:hypothetical protein AFK68_08365 [Hydrocoleum sp. CS-953]|uniref:hypothetical protein n=1 Tax=Hydrocoleum sp. CS-953 TaxID=1671698 RepID=UPI000B9B9BDC|nr:hypothetical protein [Hydrocoleum sp. CS-953]OZH54834.1 hypothetical protein AFK68_08365 [Hydrocoleum sp. CS-953]
MSKYKQSIQAFIDVIGAKIIPAEDFPDLLKVVEEMPEDDEGIAKEIDNWLKPESRSKIKEVYRVNLTNLPNSNVTKLGFGGAKMEPGKESESSKELLINKIQKNTSEPKPKENSEDKSEDK